jgi:hypothetical protein
VNQDDSPDLCKIVRSSVILLLHLLDGESEKQTHLCRTIEIKMPTIANEKISFEVKFVQYIMYFFLNYKIVNKFSLILVRKVKWLSKFTLNKSK